MNLLVCQFTCLSAICLFIYPLISCALSISLLSAYIKMGDHYWYGCRGKRDLDKAADFYGLAAQKGDPHVSL